MMKLGFFASAAILLSALLSGCENPADNAAKATVGKAEAVSESAADSPNALAIPLTPENTTIEFVGSKVTGSHEGGFKKFQGTFHLVAEQPDQSRLNAEIEMDSTWSDSDNLTEHLKSEDFFHIEKFPTAKFVSTTIKPVEKTDKKSNGKDATHTVTGNLTLHGETKSISFPATLEVTADQAKLTSEFAINRKDFGIVYPGKPDDLIRDEVVIRLAIEAPREESQADAADESGDKNAQ